jgi:DNA-binding MarR family transcriptional regulator
MLENRTNSVDSPCPDSDILEKTEVLFRKVWQQYQAYLKPAPSLLSPHQMFFLTLLERQNTVTPSEIADQFSITLGAVTGFVDRLYKLGLITRTRSETDRRQVLIQLAPPGAALLKDFKQQHRQRHQAILNRFTASELAELNQALEKFWRVLKELEQEETKRC